MNLAKGMVAGLIAAIIGSLLWAAIAFYANFEIGYLAWGIGLGVGFAVAFASTGGGPVAGVMAVVLTTLSILGGKYLSIQWSIADAIKKGELPAGFDRADITWDAMTGNLGAIDFIFFGLGVYTAWQVAYSDPVKHQQAATEEPE